MLSCWPRRRCENVLNVFRPGYCSAHELSFLHHRYPFPERNCTLGSRLVLSPALIACKNLAGMPLGSPSSCSLDFCFSLLTLSGLPTPPPPSPPKPRPSPPAARAVGPPMISSPPGWHFRAGRLVSSISVSSSRGNLEKLVIATSSFLQTVKPGGADVTSKDHAG